VTFGDGEVEKGKVDSKEGAYNFFRLFNARLELWHVPLGLIVESQFDVMFPQYGQRMLDGEFALAEALAGEALRSHFYLFYL
jgi:hypothetical protein